MISNVKNALAHLPALIYPDDPFEIAFKNFNLVIGQIDRPAIPQNMTNANFLRFARPLQKVALRLHGSVMTA